MKVSVSKKLSDNKTIPSNLTRGKSYVVIGVDWEHFRVINDQCEPVLYAKDIFDIDDPNIPPDWKEDRFDEGEYYIDPPELSESGFYEDYFDGCKKAMKTYDRYLILHGLGGFLKNR